MSKNMPPLLGPTLPILSKTDQTSTLNYEQVWRPQGWLQFTQGSAVSSCQAASRKPIYLGVPNLSSLFSLSDRIDQENNTVVVHISTYLPPKCDVRRLGKLFTWQEALKLQRNRKSNFQPTMGQPTTHPTLVYAELYAGFLQQWLQRSPCRI